MEGLIPRKDGIMSISKKYPEELRQRAQRMVAEAMSEDSSLSVTGAVKRIGPRVTGAQPKKHAFRAGEEQFANLV